MALFPLGTTHDSAIGQAGPSILSNWFQGRGDLPYLSGTQKNGQPGGPAWQIAQAVSQTAEATIKTLADSLGPQLDQLPPVAPLNWEQAGEYKLSPQLPYGQPYDELKQLFASGAYNTLNEQQLADLKRVRQASQLTGVIQPERQDLLQRLEQVTSLPQLFHTAPNYGANEALMRLYQTGGITPQSVMADPAFANDPYYQQFANAATVRPPVWMEQT